MSRVCRYWEQGHCTKGDKCDFLHPPELLGSKPPMPGWAGRGSGKGRFQGRIGGNGSVSQSSSTNDSSSPGEKRGHSGYSDRWGKQKTGKGRDSNATKSDGRSRICNFWLEGKCFRDKNCQWLHVHSTATDVEFVAELKGHEQAIRDIVLSADNTRLYSASKDKSVKAWDCATAQCLGTIQMGSDCSSLLRESEFIFVGLKDEVKIIDLNGTVLHTLHGGKGMIHSLLFFSNHLFVGCQDGSILSWKYEEGKKGFDPFLSFNGHSNFITSFIIVDHFLFSSSVDTTIKVWDLSNHGSCVQTLDAHTAPVLSMVWWENHIISCSLDQTIKVWGFANNSFTVKFSFPESPSATSPSKSTMPPSTSTTPFKPIALATAVDAFSKPILLVASEKLVRIFDLPSFGERGYLASKDTIRKILPGFGNVFFTGDESGLLKVWKFTQTQTSGS